MTEQGFRGKGVLKARRESLERLRAKGIEPFAPRFDVDATAAEVRAEFGSMSPDQITQQSRSVAGRVVLFRRHGKIVFLDIRDRTGDLQLYCGGDVMGAGFRLLDDIDLGDIVGATGCVMTTRRGELSVRVQTLTLLTKSLRPLPEKWHGLRDPGLQQRRRYLQLATDPDARKVLVEARAKVLKAIRGYLDAHGFLEVETPVLQDIAGGALARPFVTRHRALDMDLFLRISLELYLKRLLVGGLERVYEIGRNFRNEGIDRTHFPEFTMLEVYQAYGDYESMMELVTGLVREAAMDVRGSLLFDYQGRKLDLESPWARVTVVETVSEAMGEEIALDRPDLADIAGRHGVGLDPAWGPGKIILELYEKLVEPGLWGPVFVCDFPREVSPLARPHRSAPGFTEHFDPIIAGMELGAAYSELTDPDEQRAKFLEQQEARRAGDDEAHPLDEDFLMALEHGMPPAGGLGVGIDRLTMILADVPSIRDVIAFPHLRPEE